MILDLLDPSIHSVSQLNRLLQLSRSDTLGVKDALATADQLVRHGCYDGAARVLEHLAAAGHRNDTLSVRWEILSKAAEQVRATAGLEAMLADSGKMEQLLSFRSSLVDADGGSGRLVIVYSTAWNNFDISFPFLHCLISSRADVILYVKNPERGMYATGNADYGGSIDELSLNLCRLIAEVNPSRLAVLGFSGGGYAALHLAAKAGADTFLGLSIRTDWSRASGFANVRSRTAPLESDYSGNTLVNLRHLPEIASIHRAVLYCGDRDDCDRAQAFNMAGLTNFTISAVERGTHNLVMDLLVSGQLPEVLHGALD